LQSLLRSAQQPSEDSEVRPRATLVLLLLGEYNVPGCTPHWSDFTKPISINHVLTPPFHSLKALLAVLATTHPTSGREHCLSRDRLLPLFFFFRVFVAFVHPCCREAILAVMADSATNFTVTNSNFIRYHGKLMYDFLLDVFGAYKSFPEPHTLIPYFNVLLQQCNIPRAAPLDFASVDWSKARTVPSAECHESVPWDWQLERQALDTGCMFPCHPTEVRPLPYFIDGKSNEDSVKCRELPRGSHHMHRTISPGLMVIYCIMCARVIGFFMLKDKETPRQMFELIASRFPQCPLLIVYDMACKFYLYAVRRLPEFFANACCVIDSFHWPGHDHCPACFNIDSFDILFPLNDQLTEQGNSRLIRIRKSLSYMNADPFFFLTRLFCWLTEAYRAGEYN
jgi:hypothetical protein